MRKLELMFLLAAIAMSAQQSASPQSLKHATIQPKAQQLFVLANQDRAVAGIAPLTGNPALAVAARDHCTRITLEGATSHR
jgi:uncharacterized protein YkwD